MTGEGRVTGYSGLPARPGRHGSSCGGGQPAASWPPSAADSRRAAHPHPADIPLPDRRAGLSGFHPGSWSPRDKSLDLRVVPLPHQVSSFRGRTRDTYCLPLLWCISWNLCYIILTMKGRSWGYLYSLVYRVYASDVNWAAVEAIEHDYHEFDVIKHNLFRQALSFGYDCYAFFLGYLHG